MNPETKEWQANPLMIVDEDEKVVFRGKATVKFVPTGESSGLAEAEAGDFRATISVVQIQDAHLGNLGWIGINMAAHTTFVGVFLFGSDPSGRRYCWCIDRAGELYVSGGVDPDWKVSMFEEMPALDEDSE